MLASTWIFLWILQELLKVSPKIVMAPIMDLIKEASKTTKTHFHAKSAALALALAPFLEEDAFKSSENASWALDQGMSFASCSEISSNVIIYLSHLQARSASPQEAAQQCFSLNEIVSFPDIKMIVSPVFFRAELSK